MLRLLYRTRIGRLILKFLTLESLSEKAGVFLDSKYSVYLIKPFVKLKKIDMSDYIFDNFQSFNEFFTRRIRPEARPVDMDKNTLVAPCDGALTVYRVKGKLVLPVKQSKYSISRLLRSKKLTREFRDGLCLVYRLQVNDYHRYAYFDDGVKGNNHHIKGVLHTVRPVALETEPVFIENSREFTYMNTKHFGRAIQMEVGAMLVGRIDNYHGRHRFKRGDEKGKFLYGGSTVIVLLKKDAAVIDDSIMKASKKGLETSVKMGQRIGVRSVKV